MNLLGHILADTPDEIIFQIFDIPEQKLSEYRKIVSEIIYQGCATRKIPKTQVKINLLTNKK